MSPLCCCVIIFPSFYIFLALYSINIQLYIHSLYCWQTMFYLTCLLETMMAWTLLNISAENFPQNVLTGLQGCWELERDRNRDRDTYFKELTYPIMTLLFSHCHVQLFATRWTAAHGALLSSSISWNLLRFMSIDLVMLSNDLVFCLPRLLLPSIFPSIRVFSAE